LVDVTAVTALRTFVQNGDGWIFDAAGEVKFIATPEKPVIDSLLVHVLLLNGLRV
jgi:hypothetical protein